ncbi:Wadjet anti-phage system protein JetD domain-containing protein [Luteolibacter luteus]|uniref:Wadjet protein JetD C-terminal domain-containing protein n=1 Tax=Luteolibacter luteus TaxID=2728835 RepID=A0A858RL04_9BACT|nr:Wadjet anti-phage system protein JetD domain-containing protein [Luteolibacter luteus]QJE97281.1 hypothetical protein HHL09_16285 [Luteolibacter luteus]
MKHPVWLAELHRQWFAARGKKLGSRTKAYTRYWDDLLFTAGVRSAEDIATAGREAEKLEREGIVLLKRHSYRRYLIERIELPLGSEPWLRALFESPHPELLRQTSLRAVHFFLSRTHPKYPEVWSAWLLSIAKDFSEGRNARPLLWRHPDLVSELLRNVEEITSRTWQSDTLIREGSVALGFESKELEKAQRPLEACLTAMFGSPMTLGMFGFQGPGGKVELAGELTLHFEDGSQATVEGLHGVFHLTSDLDRAVKVTTPAKRVLTVENSKTTLRRIASLNEDRETLIAACAFPSRGLIRLFKLLPAELPVFHFGDTDPAGFHILSRLRRATGREVTPFLMKRRLRNHPLDLSDYDRSILPRLLGDPMLADVRPHLEEIATTGDKGDFEQESLGRPELPCWPFYRRQEHDCLPPLACDCMIPDE